MVHLDDLAWDAWAQKAITLGTCELGLARDYERLQIRQAGAVIAELIFTCGIIVYTDRVGWNGLTIASTPESVLSGPISCGGGDPIVLPAEIIAHHPDRASCTLATGDLVPSIALDIAPSDEHRDEFASPITGEVAQRFMHGKRMFALLLYQSRRCRE